LNYCTFPAQTHTHTYTHIQIHTQVLLVQERGVVLEVGRRACRCPSKASSLRKNYKFKFTVELSAGPPRGGDPVVAGSVLLSLIVRLLRFGWNTGTQGNVSIRMLPAVCPQQCIRKGSGGLSTAKRRRWIHQLLCAVPLLTITLLNHPRHSNVSQYITKLRQQRIPSKS
jgi:hypothetical protein